MRLIDGDALNAYLQDEYHGAISDSELKVYQIMRLIDNAPTIDPVKRSHWNGWTKSAYMGRLDDMGDPVFADRKFYRCDSCRHGSAVRHKHCPSCGARMDGEAE